MLWALIFLRFGFKYGGAAGGFFTLLIVDPILILLTLGVYRVVLELFMVVHRMHDDLKAIRERDDTRSDKISSPAVVHRHAVRTSTARKPSPHGLSVAEVHSRRPCYQAGIHSQAGLVHMAIHRRPGVRYLFPGKREIRVREPGKYDGEPSRTSSHDQNPHAADGR